jgi:hypothetical protein
MGPFMVKPFMFFISFTPFMVRIRRDKSNWN